MQPLNLKLKSNICTKCSTAADFSSWHWERKEEMVWWPFV